MQIIPMRELKNTVEIERRCAEENGPVFITKNGYGRLVVMDIDYYDRHACFRRIPTTPYNPVLCHRQHPAFAA